MQLNDTCVLMKTFLRDGFLEKSCRGLLQNFPDVKIVVVDDGKPSPKKFLLYRELESLGHVIVKLPFDSGFGAKANAAIPYLDKEYTLIGSDDFDFADTQARQGVEKLHTLLECLPEVAVASGSCDNGFYAGYVSREGDALKETYLDRSESAWSVVSGVRYQLCDLTVNYNLVRTKILGNPVKWKEHKIGGGEHYDFYYDVAAAGWKIAFCPDVNINQLKEFPGCMHPDYPSYRSRASNPVCMKDFAKRHNIRRYIGFDGRIDIMPPV